MMKKTTSCGLQWNEYGITITRGAFVKD